MFKQIQTHIFKQTLTRFEYIKALFLIATIIATSLFLVIPIIFISVRFNWYQLMPSYFTILKIIGPLLVCYFILATMQRLVDTGLTYQNSFICFSILLMANFTNGKMLIIYLQHVTNPKIPILMHPFSMNNLLLAIIGWLFSSIYLALLLLPSSYFAPCSYHSKKNGLF